MTFVDILHNYFQGEKTEAWFYIFPAGVLMIIMAITAWKAQSGGYAWGIIIPMLLGGLMLAGTGLGVGLRTDNQVAALEQAFRENPQAMVAQELPRMEAVNNNFHTTYIVFGVVALLGLIVHYVAGDVGRGLGAALIIIGGVGFLIDGFAERRAQPYLKALKEIQQPAP